MYDLIGYYLLTLKLGVILVASLMLLSSLDDLLIDLFYWSRATWRRLFVYSRHAPVTVEQLRGKTEQPLAVMLPAWQEAPVIASMISNLVATADYSSFVVFVGTYPNDPATGREVERMVALHPNVHCVITPRDGPTSKADCLNWVVQAIRLYEEERGVTFAGIVMHDVEDSFTRSSSDSSTG